MGALSVSVVFKMQPQIHIPPTHHLLLLLLLTHLLPTLPTFLTQYHTLSAHSSLSLAFSTSSHFSSHVFLHPLRLTSVSLVSLSSNCGLFLIDILEEWQDL